MSWGWENSSLRLGPVMRLVPQPGLEGQCITPVPSCQTFHCTPRPASMLILYEYFDNVLSKNSHWLSHAFYTYSRLNSLFRTMATKAKSKTKASRARQPQRYTSNVFSMFNQSQIQEFKVLLLMLISDCFHLKVTCN